MGRKEEQRGKVIPGNDKLFFETLRSVLYAQKGMKEELQEKIQIKQEEAAKRQGSKVFSQILS